MPLPIDEGDLPTSALVSTQARLRTLTKPLRVIRQTPLPTTIGGLPLPRYKYSTWQLKISTKPSS